MSFFKKFKEGLGKARDFLTEGVRKIALGMGRFDEDQLDELEMLLIQADIGVNNADRIMTELRAAIKTEKDDSEAFVLNFLRQEMRAVLGPERHLELQDNSLNIILLVGVNGTGKTTTAGKLALRYQKEGRSVVLVAADTFRAAAIEQLQIWADRTGSPLISHEEGSDPAAVVFDGVASAKARGADVLLIDTAGRLHNKKNLMDELGKIRRVIAREADGAKIQTLLVIDATTGQNAVLQAETFTEVAEVDNICITKLDGNAKGGVALAVAAATDLPIVLAGLGEQAEDLVDFEPESFVDSLLPSPDSGQAG